MKFDICCVFIRIEYRGFNEMKRASLISKIRMISIS